jgi:hypothetical protein
MTKVCESGGEFMRELLLKHSLTEKAHYDVFSAWLENMQTLVDLGYTSKELRGEVKKLFRHIKNCQRP